MGKVKFKSMTILSLIAFFAVLLAITIFMTIKNTNDLKGILNESIESQLISISVAAREAIDVEKFDSYNSVEDILADIDDYNATLDELRNLQEKLGVTYIYVLKQINKQFFFVFDTDTDVGIDEYFSPYDLSPIHEQAFIGNESAGVMNVVDEWGNFNTGAVPIWKDGKVAGIICADIEDSFIADSNRVSLLNAVSLVTIIFIAMCFMLIVIIMLLRNLQRIQDKLFKMANYDIITGLPNRQYLLDYLARISSAANKSQAPFALLFIDLDNFKQVNDKAGHDAGDELLRNIALYLDTVHENSKAFRPAAGILNVSARVGGDEFVQVVPGVSNIPEAEIVAKKVLDNFRNKSTERFIDKYKVGLSVGVALFPYHSSNFNVLIKYADTAMYHAKRSGKNDYRVYEDEMGQSSNE